MKRHIGLVVPALDQGGGVPAVASFLRNLIADTGKYDLSLFSLASAAADPYGVALTRPRTWLEGARSVERSWDGHPFLHVGAVGSEFEFQRNRPRKVLTEAVAQCDLLQVVCGSPAAANAVCGLGKPVSVQCATRAVVERRRHNKSTPPLTALWRRAMTTIVNRQDDRALRTVNAIQVENPWMLEYCTHLNLHKTVDLRYAPPGIATSIFKPRASRNLTDDPYILCVGRLDDTRKNIGLLLEAFAKLARIDPPSGSSVRLQLAGAAPPPRSFWLRAESLAVRDRISYIAKPTQEALVSLYQNASVFALCSDEEGLGVVVLEAMACGIPVVSTRSGGPDGIITEGYDGFLVPLDDAISMANRIHALLKDHPMNLTFGAHARTTIDRRYEQSVAGAAFLDVWDRLLSKASRG
jgi:D-inositol-3-phosphate glycosyltransferase